MGLDIFGNITNGNQTHAWVPEPTVRGTWSILSSCIITILFCIWSAVHLNVPPYNEAKFIHVTHTTWKRMGMLLLGLLAPELVTATAWYQRARAKEVVREVNSALRKSPSHLDRPANIRSNLFGTMRANQRDEEQANDPGQTYPDAHELWTMRHGFLAIMGGIALDSGGSPEPFTPYQRLTLTASGVERLAKQKPELLSPITTQAIEDKSKASNMAKAIVCVQSAWFCIQCISRFAQNLPISLLEINTFAHAFLAIVIYALWWEKPLDIAEPLLITGPDSWSISALFFTLSIISAPCPKVKGKIQKRLTEGSYVREVGGHHPANSDRVPGCPDHSTRPRGQCSKECEEWAQTTRTWEAAAQDRKARHARDITVFPGDPLPGGAFLQWLGDRDLRLVDVTRWELISRAYKSAGGDEDDREQWTLNKWSPELVSLVSSNLPRLSDLKENDLGDSAGLQAAFVVASFSYGGLHALAWGAPFESTVEQIFWWFSSVTVMSGGLIGLVLWYLVSLDVHGDPYLLWPVIYLLRRQDSLRDRLVEKKVVEVDRSARVSLDIGLFFVVLAGYALGCAAYVLALIGILMNGMIYVVAFAYCVARIFLVVDCFIQILHLPPDAFKLPVWSNYFPHIG